MSNDVRRKLKLLEEDYPGMPPAAQQADLLEINQIRAQLGLPLVDAALSEIGAAAVSEELEARPQAEDAPDHSEARGIYQAYLNKIEALAPHRAYATQVSKATAGQGQTPVFPLATMGTAGGPLLCDHCGKPIVLEGGAFHGVTADVAWQRNLRKSKRWRSWILGGMVVEIETNGTLRIYHGYPQRNSTDCCNAASRADAEARAAFDSSQRTGKWPMILAFIEHEFPDLPLEEQNDLLNDILDITYEYDPGVGVNRTDEEG